MTSELPDEAAAEVALADTLAATGDPAASSQPSMPGASLAGRYCVERQLGAGAMGVVYAARDIELDRAVAIKLLLPEAAGGDAQRRLAREAQSLASIAHPNVVAVFDVGEHDGHAFIAMELVDGETLRTWLRGNPSVAEKLRVFASASRGLAAAHSVGVVHRDFKPENVMIGADHRVRVMDFGLARATNTTPLSRSESNEENAVRASEVLLTKKGAVLGTPAYMSPEQFAGREADTRSDAFSFAVALFEALYGARPFKGESLIDLATAVLNGHADDPRPLKGVSPAVRRAIRTSLCVEPGARFADLEGFAQLLERSARSPSRRIAGVAGVAGVSVAAAAIVAAGEGQKSVCEESVRGADVAWWGQRGDLEEALSQTAGGTIQTGVALRAADDFVDRWSAVRQEACEATMIRHERPPGLMDAQMACLDRQLFALGGAVSAMRTTDAFAATRVAAELPNPDSCVRDDRRQATIGSESDEVQQLRAALAEVTALRIAGEFETAREKSVAVLERAETLGADSLTAEAYYEVGLSELELGLVDDSARNLERAAMLARSGYSDRIASEASAQMAYLRGYIQSDPEEGIRWSRTALALSDQALEPDVRLRALTIYTAVLNQNGEREAALAMAERAVEWSEQHPDVSRVVATAAKRNKAATFAMLGRHSDAIALDEEVIRDYEVLLGPEHPELVGVLTNLAGQLSRLGRYDEAIAAAGRSVEISTARGASDPIERGKALSNLAAIYSASGHPESAVAHIREGLAVLEAHDPEHVDTSTTRISLGTLHSALGDEQAARAAFAKAERALAGRVPDTDPRIMAARINAGLASAKLDDFEAADAFFDAGEAGCRQEVLNPPCIVLAGSRAELAVARGEPAQAVRILEPALANVDPVFANSKEVGALHWAAVKAYEQLGRRAEAVEEANKALAIFGQHGAAAASRYEIVREWLAVAAPGGGVDQ